MHYQPYNDECWIQLAMCIVESAAEEYAWQFPKFCTDRKEFERQDKKSYAPVRKSILNRLCNSAVRVMVDPETYRDAFERKRREAMKDFKIKNFEYPGGMEL